MCRFSFLFILLCCTLWSGCVHSGDGKGKTLTIEWDASTLRCISPQGGYARMHRLQDGRLMAVYDASGGNAALRYSNDEGNTWSEPQIIIEAFEVKDAEGNPVKVHIANAEFIELSSGELIFGCNLRPAKNEVFPFTIALCLSKDKGRTWTNPEYVYQAAPRFKDGCWEPSFLELPDGTVQVYFANESPYRESDEQEISVLESKDKGTTWSGARMVCFRKDRRDGMPVPLLSGDRIWVAIEDNAVDQFKPYLVSTTLADNWKEPVIATSQHRKMALATALPDSVYAGAPYLIKTKDYYVLSYQTTGGRTADWEKSTMEVVVSTSPDQPMGGASRPFDVPLNKEAKWNSLTDMGDNRVAAIGATNFRSESIGVWMIQGRIVEK